MTTLGALAELRGIQTGPFGTQLKASEYASEGGVPLISVGEIRMGSVQVHDSTPRVSAETIGRLPKFALTACDVVVARKGGVERSSWVSPGYGPLFLGSDGIALRFESEVDARFWGFYLQQPLCQSWLIQHAAGTTMLSMNGEILRRLPVQPFDSTQREHIAEVLGALDDKIAANRRAIDVADNLLATKFSVLRGAARGMRPLGELMRFNYGKALPAGVRVAGDVAVVGSGGVVGSHNVSLVDGPAVVLGRKGSVGATYWIDGPCYAIDTTYWVKPIEVSLHYAYYLLRSIDFAGMSTDSAVPGLNRSRAYALEVAMPDLGALERFDQFARPIVSAAGAAKAANEALAKTRDELLPLLMSGKITVKEAEKRVEGVV